MFTDQIKFFSIVSLFISISFHEFAHALMALWMGDPTAKVMGRLTLNPLKHLDPLGTLLLLTGRFGYGKPVITNPNNYNNRKLGNILVPIAGPLTNLVLALLSAIVLKLRITPITFNIFLISFLIVNISLFTFNLLPLPFLDGSHVLLTLLPFDTSIQLEEYFKHYGYMIFILAFMFPSPGNNIISIILEPINSLVLNLLV